MNEPRFLDHDWFSKPLPANVVLGEGTWIYSTFAFLHYQSRLDCGVRIGSHSGVYHGSFFELGPEGQVEIGDYCALVGAIIRTNRRVIVRDFAFVAHEVVIADSFCVAPDTALADGSEPGIEIGENAWIGARAILLGGAKIGAGAIVGAAAVVDFKVPDFAIAAGNPARIVGRVRRSV